MALTSEFEKLGTVWYTPGLPDAIRFLSVPEVLMMMGALEPCWLPLSHRTCMKILGNGIATQHALFWR